MSPEEWHRDAVGFALEAWETSLRRPDLDERARVRGALEAYRRRFVALEITQRQWRLVEPLLSLARDNIPTDVQELLVQGDPMRGVPPGALDRAILGRRRRDK